MNQDYVFRVFRRAGFPEAEVIDPKITDAGLDCVIDGVGYDDFRLAVRGSDKLAPNVLLAAPNQVILDDLRIFDQGRWVYYRLVASPSPVGIRVVVGRVRAETFLDGGLQRYFLPSVRTAGMAERASRVSMVG